MTSGGLPAAPPPPHRSSPRGRLALTLIGLALASLAVDLFWQRQGVEQVIRLGILHDRSGSMAISEKPMVEAEKLAIEEINASGGLLGRRIEAVDADSQSKPDVASREVERLLVQENVAAIVGCWTSACRKTVKPIVERHGALMIYPMAFEGLEISPNIIYVGAAPNQQVLPAVNWCFENLGKRFFVVGSDYVWPHSVNAIIGDQLKALGAELVGEAYIPFGGLDPADVVRQIRETKPDVILSTVVGDSNAPFYRALRAAGMDAKTAPVVSFSISDPEVQSLPIADLTGHYAAWPYFQSLNRPENRDFVQRFRNRYGADRVISDVAQTAYASTYFWAHAVERANSFAPSEVNPALLGLSFNAPEGIITIDPSTRHAWRSFNMGQIRGDGSIQIVWSADYPIRPVPYPRSRSVVQWDAFLADLFRQWNNNWVNLNPKTAARPVQP